MKRRLCFLPISKIASDVVVYLVQEGFSPVLAEIDDDESAVAKCFELVNQLFQMEYSLMTINLFDYLGVVKHNNIEYECISFQVPFEYANKVTALEPHHLSKITNANKTYSDSLLLASCFRLINLK